MTFARLLTSAKFEKIEAAQEEAGRKFLEFVRKSSLHFYDTARPFVPDRILIGVAANYSKIDLEFLDQVDEMIRQKGNRAFIEVFNTASCLKMTDFESFIPGIGKVFQTPVVGHWINGDLIKKLQGFNAKSYVLDYLAK